MVQADRARLVWVQSVQQDLALALSEIFLHLNKWESTSEFGMALSPGRQ
jgi:hypothetical protein